MAIKRLRSMAYPYICEACEAVQEFSCWRTDRFSICLKCNMPAAIPMWRKDFSLKPCAAEKAYWDKEAESNKVQFATISNMDNRNGNSNGNGNGKPKAEKQGKNGKRK